MRFSRGTTRAVRGIVAATALAVCSPAPAMGASPAVPLRSVAEGQGAFVNWDDANQTAVVEKQGHRLLVRIPAKSTSLDGTELSVPEVQLVNGRTLVPSSVMDQFFQIVATATPQSQLTGRYILKEPKELGHGIRMSIGSSLAHLPGDPANVFYTTADRGPNGSVQVGNEKRTTFPLATYTPTIYKIELHDGQVNVLQEIPLKLPRGTDPVTHSPLISGVSNFAGMDETPYDGTGQEKLPYDPYGLDTEGLAYNPQDDTFWIGEEYRPSLVHVSRDGTILERIVPAGEASLFAGAPDVPVKDLLPAVYANRIQNRGIEGVAITPDGKWLFAVVQSPLGNPDVTTGKKSRMMRILQFDLQKMTPVAEYPYVADDARAYQGLKPFDIVVSDLYALDDHTLLVDERDKFAGNKAQLKRIYKLDLSGATNILGRLDSAAFGGKTLEQMTVADLDHAGVIPPSKSLFVDLLQYGYPFEKVEGITMADDHTLAVANDNDFGIDNTTQTGIPSEVWLFHISTPAQ